MADIDPLDTVYFGGAKCAFAAAEGAAHSFRGHTFTATANEALRQAALSRQLPVLRAAGSHDAPRHPEEHDSELVVVAIPRTDFAVAPRVEGDEGDFKLPPALCRPLIKTADGPVAGLASGVRSGIIKDAETGMFVRLKGCGNHDQGFTTRAMLGDDGKPLHSSMSGKPLCEIRGSAFPHTVSVELCMSERIDAVLAPLGMQCGNKPLGWFEYATPDLPFPEIQRCCGLFETLGDRRLADHVLHGIEVLLPAFVDREVLRAANLASSVFPEGVFGPRAADGTIQEMDETHMLLACGGTEMPHVFADLSAFPVPGLHALKEDEADAFPPGAPEALRAVWSTSSAALSDFFSQSPEKAATLLGFLYARFGRECGIVIRSLAEAGICWGTFRDLSGMHCNAHGNNMVLIAPHIDPRGHEPSAASHARRAFLAPVDFDLAYTAAEAVLSASPENDARQAQDNIAMEMRTLAMDLGLYQSSTGTKNNHVVDPDYQVLRWALRDTMVRAFLTAAKDETGSGIDDESDDMQTWVAASHLLRLAVIKTWDVIA